MREYLAALEQANPVPPPPKRISLTAPASTWTAAAGPAIFAYSTNYLIDLKAGVIVDVEASAVSKIGLADGDGSLSEPLGGSTDFAGCASAVSDEPTSTWRSSRRPALSSAGDMSNGFIRRSKGTRSMNETEPSRLDMRPGIFLATRGVCT